MQAGGHRFDPGWLHQFSPERSAEPLGSAVRFRIGRSLTTRKKQDDFGSMWTEITGFEIASSRRGLVGRGAFKRDPATGLSSGTRAALKVIGSSD